MRSALAFSLILTLFCAVFVSTAHAAASVARGSSCVQPPASQDLTTLSDAQRQAFGLPRKPQYMSDADWKNILNHARHRFCVGVPTNVAATSQESFNNWAGNIAIGGGYQEVSAHFNVPCVSSSPRSAYSAHWIGLGGDPNDGDGNLVQDGVEADVDSNGNAKYYAWYQDYPHDKHEQFIYNVHCGDTIYAQADSNFTYSGKAYMWLLDVTLNAFSAQETSLANGSTAEWISERPTVDGISGYPTLADFNYVTFNDAAAYVNGGYQNVGQTNHNYAIMCNGGLWTCGPFSTQLAHPGPISSSGTSFTNYWDAGS